VCESNAPTMTIQNKGMMYINEEKNNFYQHKSARNTITHGPGNEAA